MKNKFGRSLITISVAAALSSCALTQNISDNRETITGCAIGTGIGALVGKKVAGKDGAWAGAALGALVGCSIGYDYQKRREALEEFAKQEQLSIQYTQISASKNASPTDSDLVLSSETNQPQTTADANTNLEVVGLSATIATDNGVAMFESSAVEPSAAAAATFKKLAALYKEGERNILITGHTDASGNNQQNQILSEQRAQAIARIFQQEGIAPTRLFYQGAGAAQPVATNSTPDGKAANRRVEVIEIDGNPDKLVAYAYKQKTNISYLSRRSQDAVAKVAAKKPVLANKTMVEQLPVTEGIQLSKKETEKLVSAAKTSKARIDFGGEPMASVSTNYTALIGSPRQNTISLISKAYADEISSLNCVAEQQRFAGEVKSLSTGKAHKAADYNTGDYLPGMYQTVWTDTVNGHLVAISPVAVLRNGGTAVADPKVKIYADYKDPSQKATASVDTQVETYFGEKGLLYRVYSNDKNSPIRCLDMVLPSSNLGMTAAGSIYYENQNKIYEADFKPQMIKQ